MAFQEAIIFKCYAITSCFFFFSCSCSCSSPGPGLVGGHCKISNKTMLKKVDVLILCLSLVAEQKDQVAPKKTPRSCRKQPYQAMLILFYRSIPKLELINVLGWTFGSVLGSSVVVAKLLGQCTVAVLILALQQLHLLGQCIPSDIQEKRNTSDVVATLLGQCSQQQ